MGNDPVPIQMVPFRRWLIQLRTGKTLTCWSWSRPRRASAGRWPTPRRVPVFPADRPKQAARISPILPGVQLPSFCRIYLHGHADHRQSLGRRHRGRRLCAVAGRRNGLGQTLAPPGGAIGNNSLFIIEINFSCPQFTNWLQCAPNGQRFRQNQSDSFTFRLPRRIGIIKKVTVGHECRGYGEAGIGREREEANHSLFTFRSRHFH